MFFDIHMYATLIFRNMISQTQSTKMRPLEGFLQQAKLFAKIYWHESQTAEKANLRIGYFTLVINQFETKSKIIQRKQS